MISHRHSNEWDEGQRFAGHKEESSGELDARIRPGSRRLENVSERIRYVISGVDFREQRNVNGLIPINKRLWNDESMD